MDQGSPLLCKSEGSWFHVAVVSQKGDKSVLTDVQVFAKTSRFGSLLNKTVGHLPAPPVALTGNSPSFQFLVQVLSVTLFVILMLFSFSLHFVRVAYYTKK